MKDVGVYQCPTCGHALANPLPAPMPPQVIRTAPIANACAGGPTFGWFQAMGYFGCALVAMLLLAGCNHQITWPPEPNRTAKKPACGTERWDVKTLADSASARVEDTPTPTTIAALNALPKNCRPASARKSGVETTLYEIEGRVAWIHDEADGDKHAVLADGPYTIVVESPAAACVQNSPFKDRLVAARSAVDGWATGQRVKVRGVGFYDYAHHQRGLSISCVEIHPILAVVDR